MDTVKKILKNSSIIIGGNIFDTIINLVTFTALARYFGQSGFGKLSFLGIFFFFIGCFDNLLINPILVREMSSDEKKSSHIIGNGLIIKGLISISVILLLWITIWSLKPPLEIVRLAFFTSIGLLTSSVISSYKIIFQIKLKIVYFTILSLLSKLSILLVIYIVVLNKGALFLFYWLSLIPSIILLLQVKHYSGKIIMPRFEIDFALWRKIFKESWPLGLSAVFIFIYHRIDQIIIFHLSGPDNVGLYSAAVRLAESLNIVPIALMASILPLMSQYFHSSKENFERAYRLCFKYLLIFIIPVAGYISIFSDNIAYFFYGKAFLSSGAALRILIWADVFVFLGVVNNSILIAANKQKIDPIFTGASALVNVILNLILIPKYGIVGAAIASLISYSIGPIMGYFIFSTRDYSRCMLYYSLKPVFVSFLIFLFIYNIHFSFLVSIFIFLIIYPIAMYLIKGIDRNDFYSLS